MKELTPWGFDKNVCNSDKLDKIYDLLAGKLTIRNYGEGRFMVWEDGAITDEIIALQSQLSKKWYTYSNYTNKSISRIREGMSESEFLKREKDFNEKEERKKKQQEAKAKAKANREKKKVNADRGIYGIYCNNKLIYIGKTNVDFKTRFQQHKEAVDNKSTIQFLYKYIVQQKEENDAEIIMKPLINVKELKVKGSINNRDIEAMELALISLYKPICNIQGVKQEYEFTL